MATREFNLDSITFDFNQVSAQDIWDFEEHSGGVALQAFTKMLKPDDDKEPEVTSENYLDHLRPLIALIWISARRDQPGLTYETVAAQPLVPLFGAIKAPDDAPGAQQLTPLEPRMTAAERRAARSAATSNAKK